MESRRASTGFTLVEILVSLIIVSMLVLSAGFGLSMFLDTWGKDRLSRQRDFPDFVHSVLFKNAIEGAYDYYVNATRRGRDYVPYFSTNGEGFAFVTANPLFGMGEKAAARARFRKEAGGSFTLVYEETPLSGMYLGRVDQQVSYTYSLPIYENIRSYELLYYGPKHIDSAGLYAQPLEIRRYRNDLDVYGWFPDYNGSSRFMLPRQIKMTLVHKDGKKRQYMFFVRTWDLLKPGLFLDERSMGAGL